MFLPLLNYLRWLKPMNILGRMAFNRYHSKVLSADDTRKIFTLNRDVSVIARENKKIIPYKYATRIIFQEPEYIAIMDCPCKKSTGTCEPVKACIAVGKPLASFWLDHCSKYNAEKITQEKALSIIRKYRQKGHITQAFFKVATGGSTGVICNCCPDCCVSLKATQYTREIDNSLSMNAESGYSIRQDPEKCCGCRTCQKTCRFHAIEYINDNRLYIKDNCMGCELCVEKCPAGALSLYRDPDKSLPLDLDKI